MSPISLASVHMGNAPAPDHLGDPSTELTPVYQCLLPAEACKTPLMWHYRCRCITSLGLLAMFQSTDAHAIPHSFPMYYLLAAFLFNPVSLPLTFYQPTALFNVPENTSTIGKNEGILCPGTGKELFAPFSFISIH